MKKTELNESQDLSPEALAQLEAMFASDAALQAAPSDDLMARVLQDAQDIQADHLAATQSTAALVPRGGVMQFFDQLFDGISAPARAVLAASVLAGMSFGYLGADTLGTLTSTIVQEVGTDVLDDVWRGEHGDI